MTTIIPYDPKPVKHFLTSLGHVEAGGCTEIRILPKESYLVINRKREYVGSTVAGYYTDYEKAARDIAPFDGKAAIHATLNPCCLKLMRRAHNKLAFKVKATASDKDIISILWFPFDVDPVRPTDTPSSDTELQAALECRDRIIKEVFEPHGVPVIRGMSGNGGHGLIPLIGYPNTPETQAKIKRLLDWLSETYTDETVSVDTTVGNPSRIWKVYGTLAVKGDNTPDAPYRRAIIELPETVERFDGMAIIDQIVPASFQSTAKTKPKASTASDGEYPILDVDRYLSHHGIEAKRRDKGGDTIWRVDCPFNPDHKMDASIQQEANGRMGFKCPHNSCKGRNWQDFREMFDPTPFFEGGKRPKATADPPSNSHPPNEGKASQPQPETDEENQDAQEKARRAQRVKSLGEKAKQRLRQGIDPERILLELKGQRDQWNDPAISDEVIEKTLNAEIQAFMPKTLNGEELMRTQFPEPKWVLSGFIGEGITVLAGRPKMGKSALALNVGVAVAHGGIALDIPCEEGDVLYCSGITEGSFPEFQDRLKNLMPGEPVSPRIHFMEDLARLDDGGEAQLRLWLKDHPDARLVVLDTLQSFAPRPKRNADAYAEGYDAMSILQRIYRDFKVSILVITHTRKSLRGAVSEWALDEVLGSTSITGASNASLVLRKSQNGFELCTFGRRIKNEEYAVTFDGKMGLWTLLGEVERHNVSDERKAILSLLEEMKGEPLSAGDIAQIVNKSAGSVKYLLIKLTQEGVVSRAQRGKYVIPTTNATVATVATVATNATNSTISPNGSDGSANGSDSSTPPTIRNHAPGTASVANGSDGSDGSGDSTTIQHGSDTNISEKSLAFLHAWQSTFGSRMVYRNKLVPLAYQAGFDMDAHGWGYDTHIVRILKELTDQTIDELTVRCLADDAYQLESQPAPQPAEKAQDTSDVPKASVDFLLGWYQKCGNHPAYRTPLLQIAKKVFPVKMGHSVSDQMDAAIAALEGKVVCGLRVVRDDSGYHLEGTPEGEVL